jgi:translation initiation factor IF-1
MVRNTHGGNKSKGMARKNMVDNTEKRKLRLSSCDLEKFAVVTRLLGNGMFYTTTNEGDELLGRIRNKFKGRSRRGNDLTLGTMVLVGLREWEAPNYKECDLLEVYDANEVKQIRQISSIDTQLFTQYFDNGTAGSGSSTKEGDDNGISFSTDADTDYFADLMPADIQSNEKERIIEDEINIDDI